MRLTYPFVEEMSEEGISMLVPRASVYLAHGDRRFRAEAVLDSGSEFTLIPEHIARYLRLPVFRRMDLEGVGEAEGMLSEIDIIFLSRQGMAFIQRVPALIGRWPDIALGRKAIFDAFRITFAQMDRMVEMARAHA